MLGSWDIFLRKAGLKKLQMLSRWPRVYWKWFWPSSKGLLGPAMRFWGHLLGWAFPKTFLWVIRHSSAGADTEMCSLVLGWEKEKSWVKISVLEGAESAKGKVSKQGVKSDVLLTFCLISILSIWSAKFCFSEMVEVRTELGQFPAACWLALGLVLFYFSFFLLAAAGGLCCGLRACSRHLVLLDGGLSPDSRVILGECSLLHRQCKKGTRM